MFSILRPPLYQKATEYCPSVRSAEGGALMRRHAGGVGCGAGGRETNAPPELGRRRGSARWPLRAACQGWVTAAGHLPGALPVPATRKGEARQGQRRGECRPSSKSAAGRFPVARRETPAFSKGSAAPQPLGSHGGYEIPGAAAMTFLCPGCNTVGTFKHNAGSHPQLPRFGHTVQRHRGPPEAVSPRKTPARRPATVSGAGRQGRWTPRPV